VEETDEVGKQNDIDIWIAERLVAQTCGNAT